MSNSKSCSCPFSSLLALLRRPLIITILTFITLSMQPNLTSAHVFQTNFTSAESWAYVGRFCFRQSMKTARTAGDSTVAETKPSELKLWVTSERQVPLFFTVYFDDPYSKEVCDNDHECFNSNVAFDRWSNVYRGVPADPEAKPSCSWRMNVSEKRGGLFHLGKLVKSQASSNSNASRVPATLTLPFLAQEDRSYYFAFAACEFAGAEYPLQGVQITVSMTNSYSEANMAYLSSDEYEEMICCRWGASLTAFLLLASAVRQYHRHSTGAKMHRLPGLTIISLIEVMIGFSARAAYFARRGAPKGAAGNDDDGLVWGEEVRTTSIDPNWWLDADLDVIAGCCEMTGRVFTLLVSLFCMKAWGVPGSSSRPKLSALERVLMAFVLAGYATSETIFVFVVANDEGYSRSGPGEATAWTSARLVMRIVVVGLILQDVFGGRAKFRARKPEQCVLEHSIAITSIVWLITGATVGSRLASPFDNGASNPCEEAVSARYTETTTLLLILVCQVAVVFHPGVREVHKPSRRTKKACGLCEGGPLWEHKKKPLAEQMSHVKSEIDNSLRTLESMLEELEKKSLKLNNMKKDNPSSWQSPHQDEEKEEEARRKKMGYARNSELDNSTKGIKVGQFGLQFS